jgi:hypothetical protein
MSCVDCLSYFRNTVDLAHIVLGVFTATAPLWTADENQTTLLLFYILMLMDWSVDAECSLTLLADPTQKAPPSLLESWFDLPASDAALDAMILTVVWMNTFITFARVAEQNKGKVMTCPIISIGVGVLTAAFLEAKVVRRGVYSEYSRDEVLRVF